MQLAFNKLNIGDNKALTVAIVNYRGADTLSAFMILRPLTVPGRRDRQHAFLANSRLRSLYAIAGLSVCLSVVCLSVTFAHTIQPGEIFGNVFLPFGTVAIR